MLTKKPFIVLPGRRQCRPRSSAGAAALLSILLAAPQAAGGGENDAAAEAVRAARAAAVPDFGSMVRNADKSQYLDAFGGGDLSLTAEQSALYQNGAGELYGPAVARVTGCRNASDPECLAVQVLDKGFPERPAVGDDVLAGRDEIVEGAEGVPPGTSTDDGTCHDFVVSVPAQTSVEVCRAGGWFEDVSCDAGWMAAQETSLTRWACTKMEAVAEPLVCQAPADFTTKPVYAERCFFDLDAFPTAASGRETAAASASASFPAVCDETRFTEEEFTCDAVLSVSPQASCTMGETTSGQAVGDSTLFDDECPGGDTLTLSHECRREAAASRAVLLSLNGWGDGVSLRSGNSITVAHPTASVCKARLTVVSIDCTGLSCIASAEAVIYGSGVPRGTISAKLPFTAYGQSSALEDVWSDGCATLSGDES